MAKVRDEDKIPRIPPPGHRYPPDVVDHIHQLRGLMLPPMPLGDTSIPDEEWHRLSMERRDYPPAGSPEEMTLEELAVECGYKLPVPADWLPPKLPNIDEMLHNADWLKGDKN